MEVGKKSGRVVRFRYSALLDNGHRCREISREKAFGSIDIRQTFEKDRKVQLSRFNAGTVCTRSGMT